MTTFRKLILLLVIVLVVLISGFLLIENNKKTDHLEQEEIKLLDNKIEAPVESTVYIENRNSKITLKDVVEKNLDETPARFGIYIKDLSTDEEYFLNEHQKFPAASLYKLWVMATAFDQIKKGVFDEDEILSQYVNILNKKFNISSKEAELTEGVTTLSVKDALFKMIAYSHNYAALLLSEKVRLSSVNAFLKEYNFTESTLGEPPETTAYDILLFFEKLYQGNLIDQEYSQKMLALLKEQTLNNKLPKYLPKEISLAHKTGEIGYFTHDAGIVFSDKGDYVIVVLTESDFPSAAEEQIANISKSVYEYFK